ncbi:MAG: hypothetical protein FWG67_05000 [Defluviitaleaceae bacterium]|nr:hypothetical protein [Defluviitaleaceae bacterium]
MNIVKNKTSKLDLSKKDYNTSAYIMSKTITTYSGFSAKNPKNKMLKRQVAQFLRKLKRSTLLLI